MIRQNLHTHTVYDDGKNTPAEMAEAALDAGFHSLGFSGHSILPFVNDWSMTEESFQEYMRDVENIREIYSGRLSVFCGIEWDLLSKQDTARFDYVIGAVHHIPSPADIPLSVDESPETTQMILKEYYRGDPMRMAEAYYAQYEELSRQDDVDIVAHFDLLTKFDEKYSVFDTDNPRYSDAAMSAMELLLKSGKIIELNTGAMSRGWRSTPYPSKTILRELLQRNARILVSADAHSANSLSFAFLETEKMLKDIGFRERWEFTSDGFSPVPL